VCPKKFILESTPFIQCW